MRVTKSLREAKKQIEQASYPNVQGIGIGYKTKDGKRTKELAVIVFVSPKVAEKKLTRKSLIPKIVKTTDGDVKTDVIESGEFMATSLCDKTRPIIPGCSVGHPDVTAGTIGLIVKKIGEDKSYILSNNHVLANLNKANIGDPILQPGTYDKGTDKDVVAHLSCFVPIEIIKRRKRNLLGDGYNLCDCAIACLDEGITYNQEVYKIGKPTGITTGKLGMKVRKTGRTTGYTEGEIIAVDVSVRLNLGMGTAVFSDQLIASKMCEEGDSGAAVFDKGTKVVGLLFASGHEVSLINKIQNVFDALKVELIG